MRIWSLHPLYLDRIGIIALWRETLLAQKVLQGKTNGYKFHPQLIRFKKYPEPLKAISAYLTYVYFEATERGYSFDKRKIEILELKEIIPIKRGQIQFEAHHLKSKIRSRKSLCLKNNRIFTDKTFLPNPIFKVVDGDIEEWEKIK